MTRVYSIQFNPFLIDIVNIYWKPNAWESGFCRSMLIVFFPKEILLNHGAANRMIEVSVHFESVKSQCAIDFVQFPIPIQSMLVLG